MIELPTPTLQYDRSNEAAARGLMQQEIARLTEAVRELERRLKAAGIP